jgi:SHS2 domain-containing protein
MDNKPIVHLLDHTADIGFVVKSPDAVSLFKASAETMMRLIMPYMPKGPIDVMRLDLRADSLEDLFREWLGELLYRHIITQSMFSHYAITSLTGTALSATVHRQRLNEQELAMCTEIKAVTYHGLYVKETDTGFEARVIFDT